MKKFFSTLCLLLLLNLSYAQTVFYTSPVTYTKEELYSFYSSLSLQGGYILYNAPDYKLYAISAATHKEEWSYDLNYRSTISPFLVSDSSLWANSSNGVVQLSLRDGALQKNDFPFASIATKPFVQNNLLYATGIYEAGCLFAYDMQKDTLLWHRFLAHGVSVKPYYQKDVIIANAESDNWLEVAFSGKLKEASCDTQQVDFPGEYSCVKNFTAITHDGRMIKDKLAEKFAMAGDIHSSVVQVKGKTLVLGDNTFYVLGDKLKIKSKVDLPSLLPENAVPLEYGDSEIIKESADTVWILYSDHVIEYNWAKKKMVKIIDLQKFTPKKVVVNEKEIWLISRTDGKLYGMSF